MTQKTTYKVNFLQLKIFHGRLIHMTMSKYRGKYHSGHVLKNQKLCRMEFLFSKNLFPIVNCLQAHIIYKFGKAWACPSTWCHPGWVRVFEIFEKQPFYIVCLVFSKDLLTSHCENTESESLDSSIDFLYDFTLFVIDMHENRSLSTFLTPFDHFQKRVFGRLIS